MKILKESAEQLDGFQRELQIMLNEIKEAKDDNSINDEREATRNYLMCKIFFEKATGKKVDSYNWKIIIGK